MAQDLLNITQEAFQLQLYKISSGQLIDLIRQIYEFKWENGKDFPEPVIMDLERKETKINAELMRRNVLTGRDYDDYFTWIRKINKKKRVW